MSKVQNIKKLPTDNAEFTRVQEYISRAFGGLIGSQILDGVLLNSLNLTTGLNEISHKLGRKPQGWIVVRKRANIDVWDSQDTNNKPQLKLALQSAGDVVIDLWIF